MNTNKANISQIRKYLNGELDARAMHELERQALDDPFLQDALEGYQHRSNDQQQNINELSRRLQIRVNPQKKRMALWAMMAVAASVLLFISAGSWWLMNYRAPSSRPDITGADKTIVAKAKPAPVVAQSSALQKEDRAVLKPAVTEDMVAAPATGNSAPPPPVVVNDEEKLSEPLSVVASERQARDSSELLAERAGGYKAIRIRGLSSVAANKPLYIVDGKVFGGELKGIDEHNIANISVLKDASATAIYGSKAANGVIIINTRNGLLGRKNADSNLMANNQTRKAPLTGYRTEVKREMPNSLPGANLDTLQAVTIQQTLQGRLAGVAVGNSGKRKRIVENKTITGQVLSEDDKLPIPGVSVVVNGKNTAVLTDVNGKFNIEASTKDELSIRYIGYSTKNVKVKDSLKVLLEPNHDSLAEVVVVSEPTAVTKQAHPISGWDNFNKYLQRETAGANEAGVVRLSFTVNPDKTLSNFKIIKSLSADADRVATDIIKNGPQWVPNINGKPETVKVRIKFSR